MKRIYLDYAATTPTKKEVWEAMKPYFLTEFGNPSSLHSFGQKARARVDWAREELARFLNCQPTEIIFTSGGTESDNLVLKGLVNYYLNTFKTKPHLITSQIEHHAILHTCQDLEERGWAEVSYLPVDQYGRLKVAEVEKAIRENTILVSIMYANNEIGTIEPIREVGKMIERVNRKRAKEKRIFFHTDAVQAVGYLNCDVQHLHLDLLSLSGHKIGGPKGIGALYVRKGVPLQPELTGGAQEFGLRAGTENVPGIVGLGKAIELLQSKAYQNKVARMVKLRDYLIENVLKTIDDVILTGHSTERLPNSASFCFKYVEGESILISLDLEGVAASSGSACTSRSLEPSHVLLACGLDHQTAQGSIRLTLGEETKKEEIDHLLKVLPKIIERLRKMSPFGNQNKNQKPKER